MAAESSRIGQEIRELLCGRRRFKYRILFRIKRSTVEILRVWHCSRDDIPSTDIESRSGRIISARTMAVGLARYAAAFKRRGTTSSDSSLDSFGASPRLILRSVASQSSPHTAANEAATAISGSSHNRGVTRQ